jgi:acetylornithine aminotransferase
LNATVFSHTRRHSVIISPLRSWGLDHDLITSVRGRGLLQAVILAAPIAAAVVDAALAAGFVINAPRPDVLRVAPPLIISSAELDHFVRALPSLLDRVAEELR